MAHKHYYVIWGKKDGQRLRSRDLEETIQRAVEKGYRDLNIKAYGQHGIGGRLWRAGEEPVMVRIDGNAGQRVGSMGYPNTVIEVMGPASDDVGWLNSGAEIVVHGNAANGAANAMAQGKIFVAGNIGARGMTMTKHNPRFDPPELWVLGSVGDYFGEFMAGGIAVVCGIDPQTSDNVLGYRPLVGMVGGKVFFHGPHAGFSQGDAKMVPIEDEDWAWLQGNLKGFLKRIGRTELYPSLSEPSVWQLLTARTPLERMGQSKVSMAVFRKSVWEKELGQGGLIGDLTQTDRSTIPVITTGDLRRFVPLWENRKYSAPCEASCPTGIPVHDRWRLIRDGRVDEAVDMALAYTPFPALVCGYLCPNLCMHGCTRHSEFMLPVDITPLGKASIEAAMPSLPALKGPKVAVIGGGPGGISVAWQLRRQGYEATVFDTAKMLGGKIASVIPESRIPAEVVTAELERAQTILPHIHLQQKLTAKEVSGLAEDYAFIVIAVGAQKPRMLDVPGNERIIPALDFLTQAKSNAITPGKRVVVIGAGNVGCDVATEAHRLGAEDVLLIDVQEPASYGAERDAAEAIGARFQWPCFTAAITEQGVALTTGEVLPADTVIISIGDQPELNFLPPEVATEGGFIVVNEHYQTTDSRIFAIGDAVKPGLLTDAIGSGRKAAAAIIDLLEGRRPVHDTRQMIDMQRVNLEYYDPRITEFEDVAHCGSSCASCGACRDCGICSTICPVGAISRLAKIGNEYEYVVDDTLCIGCGFCAGACPCGVWDLVENTPMD